jgi:hypothetical protein
MCLLCLGVRGLGRVIGPVSINSRQLIDADGRNKGIHSQQIIILWNDLSGISAPYHASHC